MYGLILSSLSLAGDGLGEGEQVEEGFLEDCALLPAQSESLHMRPRPLHVLKASRDAAVLEDGPMV